MSGPDDECICERCGGAFPADEMQPAPETSQYSGVDLCNDCTAEES